MKAWIINILEKGFNTFNNGIRWFRRHQKATRLISIVFSLLFIAYLFYYLRDDFQTIIASIEFMKFKYLLYSHLLYGANFYLFFYAWLLLLKPYVIQYDSTVSLRIFSTTYLSKFIPTPVMFYLSRIAQLDQIGINAKESITITAVEAIYQIFSGLALLGVLNIKPQNPITLLWLLSILPAIFLITIPSLIPSGEGVGDQKKNTPKQKLVVMAIQTLPWILGGVFFFFIIKSVNPSEGVVNFISILRIWILANLSSLVGSYIFGGLGVLREFTLVLLLQDIYTSSTAILLTALVRIMLTLSGLFWAAINYLIILIFVRKKQN